MADDIATHKADHAFIRKAMTTPILEREHEHDLAVAWRDKGDEKALHQLVRAYGRLVVAMASKFRHYGLPLGDLIQEGNVGLMQAAARFEPEREVRFSTYASWWIRSTIQDYVLRNWSIVRTGSTSAHKSLFFNLRRLRSKIANTTGEMDLTEQSRMQIAKELGVSVKDVEVMEQRLAAHDQSLNVMVSDDSDDDWQGFLVDERPTPEQVVIGARDAKSRSAWLNSALGQLTDRERTIIEVRRLSEDGATLEDLGKTLGISKERVRQLESRAMSKLKASLTRTAKSPEDYLTDA
jgi:RNA polymerase sigma-32 factor